MIRGSPSDTRLKNRALTVWAVVTPAGAALSEASMPDPFAAPDDEGSLPLASVKPLHFYLALRAADLFHIEHARWPGSLNPIEGEGGDPDGEKDAEEMQTCWEKVAKICLGVGESESEGEGGPAQAELSEEERDMVEQALKEMWVPIPVLQRFLQRVFEDRHADAIPK